jgi:hypothetical protein
MARTLLRDLQHAPSARWEHIRDLGPRAALDVLWGGGRPLARRSALHAPRTHTSTLQGRAMHLHAGRAPRGHTLQGWATLILHAAHALLGAFNKGQAALCVWQGHTPIWGARCVFHALLAPTRWKGLQHACNARKGHSVPRISPRTAHRVPQGPSRCSWGRLCVPSARRDRTPTYRGLTRAVCASTGSMRRPGRAR